MEPCPVVWWDQDKLIWFSWCQACVATTRWGVQSKRVLHTVKHAGGSVMVWGCMSAAGTGELWLIEGNMNADKYCDILKQSMIPSLWKLGRRAVFQHDNDPKHTSKTTTALLKKLRVKVMDWPSISPDLNPIEQLCAILRRKVEECKVSNIHQLHDVHMEEWKRIPVNSMPKKVKAVLENKSGHTKYWHFGPNLDILT